MFPLTYGIHLTKMTKKVMSKDQQEAQKAIIAAEWKKIYRKPSKKRKFMAEFLRKELDPGCIFSKVRPAKS